jgi:thiamine pyrophosphate-dependent acetolactate synthase large subunit-like protein
MKTTNDPLLRAPSTSAEERRPDKDSAAGSSHNIGTSAEQEQAVWGSDAIAKLLRTFEIPYVCINPGSSFRGLHDSLVNYNGNTQPQIIVCLHEEHAVAMAHGYAKVTGRPLAVIVHSNVGLMHATMAIFDAWCDRVPILIMGATGPVDAAKRRPWIDWLHTARDQGALVRHFIKWDDQPSSILAAYESLLRAKQIAETAPKGPVYVCFDAELQESKLESLPPIPAVERFRPPIPSVPDPLAVREAAEWLANAKTPVILMGRVSRDEAAWQMRLALAEKLGATVFTDLKIGAAFPTDHDLHAAPPSHFLSQGAAAQLREADVILSLDWLDLAGTLKQAWGTSEVAAKVIQVSVDQYVHNGWSMDYQGLPPADLYLVCEPEPFVTALLPAVGLRRGIRPRRAAPPTSEVDETSGTTISIAFLARELKRALGSTAVSLIRLPLSWSGEFWDFHHPLDYLGTEGGAGVGSGPGMAVGAALALRGTGRLPIAILGDGDFLMGATAFWTAANLRIPLLTVVANNRSFFNDELHQERVAKQRGRPVENRWIGQRIDDPDPDLAMLARAQGLKGFGPVNSRESLFETFVEAVECVKQGQACVVDVRITPGYSPSMTAGLLRSVGE